MATSYIDEYLVKLGSSVDASGMARFNQALREAASVANVNAASIAVSFFKAQTEILAGFAAIGGAAVGLVDKVAMADQSYRLFAMHMYMSKDAARGLKVAMDALGEPLENLTFDPELRDRARMIIEAQRLMIGGESPDTEAQLRKVRDIRAQFTLMEVELEQLGREVVVDFLRSLGTGPDQLLEKLKLFNFWAQHNVPQIAAALTREFMPVWRDMEGIARQLGEGIYDAAGGFQSLVGILSGDDSLDTSVVTLESMARTLEHVAHAMATVLKLMIAVEDQSISMAKAGLHGAKGLYDWQLGMGDDADNAEAGKEFEKAGKEWNRKLKSAKDLDDLLNGTSEAAPAPSSGLPIHGLIDKYAAQFGVDPALAHAVAMHESREQQYGRNGAVLVNTERPGNTAAGVFQLTNATARTLGVDSHDTDQNVIGGVKLLHQMLVRYHGNLGEAIGAYGEGAGTMDAVLAGRATLRPEARANIASVERAMGATGDIHIGDIVINIDKPNATNADVGRAVAARIQSLKSKQVQRNLAEFQPWGYTGN